MIRGMGHHLGAMSIAVAALGLTAAACSSSPGTAPAARAHRLPAAPRSAPSPRRSARSSSTPKSRTVYDFANDKTSASSCTEACAANWPFVLDRRRFRRRCPA